MRLNTARARKRSDPEAPLLLHVFPSFASGGAQMRFVALANHFGPSFRHAVIALDGDFATKSKLSPEVSITFLDPPAPAGFISRISGYRHVLRRLKPDVLVTSNWGAIEWAIANLFPLARHIHTEDGFGKEERDRQIARRVWARRLALRRSLVIVPSWQLFYIATEKWRLPRGRVLRIPNGIDLERFAPRHDRAPDRASGTLVVGSVAALRPEKNVGRLLHAFRLLPDAATLRLVIAGCGPEQGALHTLAGDLGLDVEFAGEVGDPAALYRSFDIFALASDTEQMPLSVLEAMASGLPVASTDVGDIKRMVAPSNQPFVTGRSDQELARSLATLLASPALRAEIGAANRERAERDYDARAMVERYRKIYAGEEGETR